MTSVLTRAAARLLLAPTFVIALAILVKGYSDVGDGFSAGVVAALGVLVQYLAFGVRETERLLPVRFAPAAVIAGLLLALVVAFAPLAWGEPPLTHLPYAKADVVHLGTLELLTAVAFDVGVFLLVLGASVGIIRTIALARLRRMA
ncbi:MAG: MnhB domain-containing protein [Thermoleophilaceae bacterium]